jgi:hypothetical protein
VSDSDLIEVVERNGEFRKWGRFWGPLLYWRSLNAARPSSLLKNLEMESFLILAGRCWDSAVGLEVIF